MEKTAVIIVNYNGKPYIEECIDSLLTQTYQDFNIIVVDNDSVDGSRQLIKSYKTVTLIELDKNKGFATATNIGIQKAQENENTKYIVLLNNDTVCDKYFLQELTSTVHNDKSIGMAACKMLFLKKPQYINNAGGMIRDTGCFDGRGFNEKDDNRFNTKREVFAPSGGAGLYTLSMLSDVAYKGEFFDESFFAYHEDIDIAWRARLRGWRCTYNPKAIVYHHHSATLGNSSKKKYLCIRNNMLCLYKCLSPAVYKKFWWKILFYSFTLTGKQLILFDYQSAKAIIDGIKYIPSLKDKRKYIQNTRTISDHEMKQMWRKTIIENVT